MKIAAVSTAAQQLVLNNVTPATGFKYFDDINYIGIAEYNPDAIYFGGWFVTEYSDWSLHQSLMGDIPKVIIHWYGSDVLQCRNWRNMGQERMFEILRSDRYVHIPPNDKIKKEIEEWLELPTTSPLNVCSERLLPEIPKPDRFTVGCYMPPGRQDFFRMRSVEEAMKRAKKTEWILYHWMPPVPAIEAGNGAQRRYALSREEYDKTLADCSCLLRIPKHDAYSISAAEFLMSGRPVISDRDLPKWPARIRGKLSDAKVAAAIAHTKTANTVPVDVQNFYRNMFDPSKFKDRLQERCQEKWPEMVL